jgi:hypothetical protein
VLRLLVTASVVPSSPILVTLMKEALISSETSVLTRATLRNIPEDAILHCAVLSVMCQEWIFFSVYSVFEYLILLPVLLVEFTTCSGVWQH